MKVLITGAAGFVGSAIVTELAARQAEIIQINRRKVLVGQATRSEKNTFITADITEYKNLKRIVLPAGIDGVIHAAGLAHQFGEIDKRQFVQTNVRGTENIVRLAIDAGIGKFILISSTAVYGIKKSPVSAATMPDEDLAIDETADCRPENAYAASKLEAERSAAELCRRAGIDLTTLRLPPVVGENNIGNLRHLIEAIDKNRFLWLGTGGNRKTLIYKNDVAKACYSVLNGNVKGTEVFNLAGEPLRMKRLVEVIARRLDKKIPGVSIPEAAINVIFELNSRLLKLKKVEKLSKTVEKWLSNDIYSAKKIYDFYGFRAETPIETALERQVQASMEEKNHRKSNPLD